MPPRQQAKTSAKCIQRRSHRSAVQATIDRCGWTHPTAHDYSNDETDAESRYSRIRVMPSLPEQRSKDRQRRC